MTFVPLDCATWILGREADGPLNIFDASRGVFPMITDREPPFKEALDWLQFAFTAERAGAYAVPESTFLIQSAVAERGKLFPEFLVHLRRLYTEVYVPMVSTGRAPGNRGF